MTQSRRIGCTRPHPLPSMAVFAVTGIIAISTITASASAMRGPAPRYDADGAAQPASPLPIAYGLHLNSPASTAALRRSGTCPKGNGDLQNAAASAPGDVWAVGYKSVHCHRILELIEHWNGKTWNMSPAPLPAGRQSRYLFGVSALAANDAWAVGIRQTRGDTSRTEIIEHWNGIQWRNVSTPPALPKHARSLIDVQAISRTDVWAAGYVSTGNEFNEHFRPLFEHWNGLKWRVVPSPTRQNHHDSPIFRMSVVTPNDIWAAGAGIVEHWNGKRWRIVPFLKDKDLNDVSAITRGNVWTAGDGVQHWNGRQWWSVPNSRLDQERFFLSLDARARTDIWVVGGFSRAVTYHWNGSKWSARNPYTPASSRLNTVLSLSSNNAWAAGVTGPDTSGDNPTGALIDHWNGTRWTVSLNLR